MSGALARIALSFFVAGSWIAGVTLLGERLGARKAGLIANLPSNILVSLLFMALTRGASYAAAATSGVPVGMTIDALFLAVLVLFLDRGIGVALAAALATWALAAAAMVLVVPQFSFAGSIVLFVAVSAVLFFIVDREVGRAKVEKKPVRFTWKTAGLRAIFAGSVVAGAVTLAQFAPPYMTGILATFPAVLTSTMVILTKSQGPAFAKATGKILLLSSGNIIVYTTCAGILFPLVGPWAGTAISFVASFVSVALIGAVTAKVR